MNIRQITQKIGEHIVRRKNEYVAGFTVVALSVPAVAGASPKLFANGNVIYQGEPQQRTRVQVVGVGLPLNSDINLVREEYNGGDLFKARAQALPFEYGALSAGVTAQYVNPPVGEEHTEAGLVGRLAIKAEDGTRLQVDGRWFPTEDTVDTTVLVGNKNLSIDFIGSHNYGTGDSMGRLGIGCRVAGQVFIGPEIKFTDTNDSNVKVSYVGARATVQLPF